MELSIELQTILNNIKLILNSENITDDFLADVLKRLESLGYTAKDADTWVISFSVQKVENSIKNSCNTPTIPDGLKQTAIDMICGEFLFSKKQSGQLEGFNLEVAIKQIQTGDTSTTFAVEGSSSPEQRLDVLISFLLNYGRGDFVSYRKISW